MADLRDEQPSMNQNYGIEVEELDDVNAESEFFAALQAQSRVNEADSPATIEDEIGNLAIFRGLDVAEIPGLLAICQVSDFGESHVLIPKGQINKAIYFLLDGRLKIISENNVIGFVEQGQCIGLRSVVDGKPSTASFVVSEASRVVAIEYQLLIGLIDQSHQLTMNLFYELTKCVKGDNYKRVGTASDNSSVGQYIDSLTGLHNHTWLEKMLPRQLSKCILNKSALLVTVFEVKEIAEIEKEYGKVVSENVIRTVTDVIENNLPENDLLVRDDDNIFIVISSDSDHKSVSRIFLDSIESAVGSLNLVTPGGEKISKITVNSATLIQDKQEPADAVIEKARQVCIRQGTNIREFGNRSIYR